MRLVRVSGRLELASDSSLGLTAAGDKVREADR
jgi:hypothetical protein